MKEHPQAELLRTIADGKQMQCKYSTGWSDVDAHCALAYICNDAIEDVRIKPATILVNGIEVPEPMRVAPADETKYWMPAIQVASIFSIPYLWTGDSNDWACLKRGLCHTTEAAAIAHAKAMLAPSMKGGE